LLAVFQLSLLFAFVLEVVGQEDALLNAVGCELCKGNVVVLDGVSEDGGGDAALHLSDDWVLRLFEVVMLTDLQTNVLVPLLFLELLLRFPQHLRLFVAERVRLRVPLVKRPDVERDGRVEGPPKHSLAVGLCLLLDAQVVVVKGLHAQQRLLQRGEQRRGGHLRLQKRGQGGRGGGGRLLLKVDYVQFVLGGVRVQVEPILVVIQT